jgi:hypothetical protein
MKETSPKKEDNKLIPEETRIYFSKVSLFLYWLLGIGLFTFGVYIVLKGDIPVPGFFVIFISFLFIFYAKKRTPIRDPYIVLNEEGISTMGSRFIRWKDIKSIKTELAGSGRNAKWYLIIEYKEAKQDGKRSSSIEINELSVPPGEIEELIKVYQGRNKNS